MQGRGLETSRCRRTHPWGSLLMIPSREVLVTLWRDKRTRRGTWLAGSSGSTARRCLLAQAAHPCRARGLQGCRGLPRGRGSGQGQEQPCPPRCPHCHPFPCRPPHAGARRQPGWGGQALGCLGQQSPLVPAQPGGQRSVPFCDSVSPEAPAVGGCPKDMLVTLRARASLLLGRGGQRLTPHLSIVPRAGTGSGGKERCRGKDGEGDPWFAPWEEEETQTGPRWVRGAAGPARAPIGGSAAPRCKSHQWRLPLFFLLQHDEGCREELVCALACGRSLGAGCPG